MTGRFVGGGIGNWKKGASHVGDARDGGLYGWGGRKMVYSKRASYLCVQFGR